MSCGLKQLFFYLLLLLTLSLSSLLAQASKARVQSLANSFHLLDAQSVYRRPIDLIYLDNFVVLESGVTAATSINDNAEAMLSYTYNNNRHIALSFGHQDRAVVDSRNFINLLSGSAFVLAQNPLYVFYAVDDSITSYAVGISYSAKNEKKLTNLKESSVGISLGVEMGKFQVNSVFVPINSTSASAGKQFEGGGYSQVTGSYLSDQTLFEFTYAVSKSRLATEAGAVIEDHIKDEFTLGLVDSNSQHANNFFWGAQIISTRINCKINLSATCNKTFSRSILPVWFGIEAQANDWLSLRGAVKQSFLASLTDAVGYPAGAVADITAAANDTVVSMGLGFNFKSMAVDGTLSTASTQVLNTANFLSQVGLTYSF